MNWRIGQLQSQHDACLAIVEDIQARSAHIADRASAVEITLMLARLTGILRIHLALEDEILYPALRNAKDPKIAAAAEHHWQEMGGLADTFLDFVDRWKRADMVLNESELFRRESAGVFKALGDRIGREHAEIYPMAEKLRAARAA
ncbi:hemerythrin domain-containing protein [Blastomonas sp. AAP53]|uniref:hemerythrin domain-containing protein n=1 Tax=Blastomonas sp. AAP53 TaxID=1248760 RepID=UPI0002D480F4|nr:hemerythrin domain-containing protein [Blastomonas sp. AAP53]